MFIEKFIVNPRHIEIQVLGDKHGNVIHLGERECSIQRRNQKVVEEAPSPLLDARTRAAMGAQAVELARAVGYDSAGTVEFVAGQDRSFFFLEMNTRLQVEHPVTELVTGIDLVEEMIRSAAGEPLRLKQSDVKLTGWAVESRIYAEDPYRGFLPSIGRLLTYRPPAETSRGGVTVRNDTGVGEGGEISMFYDPMIAKLVTHAGTRAAAIEAQADALDGFCIEGIGHNIPFLAALMQHPRWREGRLSTGFIAEEFAGGFSARPPNAAELEVLACVAAQIDHQANNRRREITNQIAGAAVRFSRSRIVEIAGKRLPLEVSGTLGSPTTVTFTNGNGEPSQNGVAPLLVVSAWWPGEPVWRGSVDGKPIAVQVRPMLNGYELAWRGLAVKAFVYTRQEAELASMMPAKIAADTSKLLLCPMPGLVKAIHVGAGAEVKAGDPLAVVEAMKMENILKAERDGVVKSVKAKAGDSLAVDAVILEFV